MGGLNSPKEKQEKNEKLVLKPDRSSGKQSNKDWQQQMNRLLGKIQNRVEGNFIMCYSPVPSSCLEQCNLDQLPVASLKPEWSEETLLRGSNQLGSFLETGIGSTPGMSIAAAGEQMCQCGGGGCTLTRSGTNLDPTLRVLLQHLGTHLAQ